MCTLSLFNDVFQQQWPNSAEKNLKLSFKDYSARISKGTAEAYFSVLYRQNTWQTDKTT